MSAPTSTPERVREAVIALHYRGIKPTPRNLYEELHYGKKAPHGRPGMRIINGYQGRFRTATMYDLGWRRGKGGIWEPPPDWPEVVQDKRRVEPRERLGEA